MQAAHFSVHQKIRLPGLKPCDGLSIIQQEANSRGLIAKKHLEIIGIKNRQARILARFRAKPMKWYRPAYGYLLASSVALSAVIGCVTRDPNWLIGVGISSLVTFGLLFCLYLLCQRFTVSIWLPGRLQSGFCSVWLQGLGCMWVYRLSGNRPNSKEQAISFKMPT